VIAELLRIGQLKIGAFKYLCLFQVGLSAGGLASVKASLLMAAVTEGLLAGLAAAAEDIAFLSRMLFFIQELDGVARLIGYNHLLIERQCTCYPVWAIFDYLDLLFVLRF